MSQRLLILALVATAAAAQPATRAEVAAQRAAIEQRFERETRDCERQFSVSSCLDDVRHRRHDALAPLVRREHELAADERRTRAAAQAQRVRERELAAAQEEGQKQQRTLMAPALAAPSLQAPRVPRAASPASSVQQHLQAEKRAATEAERRREQLEQRQREQRQRAAEHEARRRSRGKPAAAPLPLPGASAASSLHPPSRQ